MSNHNITFHASIEGKFIEVECSCGAVAKAETGKDAMEVARFHVEFERTKELTQGTIQ